MASRLQRQLQRLTAHLVVALVALVVIGGCGTWAALRMPRWDEQPLGNRAVATTLILVLSAWLATGLAAEIWRLG